MRNKIIFCASRFLRIWTWFRLLFCNLDLVCISNYRDGADYLNFGFKNSGYAPDVLPWVMFERNGVRGRLFMINSTAEEAAGKSATVESLVKAKKQFLQACQKAIISGAKVILLAASTKRLFSLEELKELFPGIIFTIGDNFTSLLLQKQIVQIISKFPKYEKPKVLVLAPYGHLGKFVVNTLRTMNCVIIGLGKKARLRGDEGFQPVISFEEVGKVDLVVACHHDEIFRLTRERVKNICKDNRKLIVVDPCEPANMPPDVYLQSSDLAIRLDAGNGYSEDLKYIGGKLAWSLLRLSRGVIWGCFCEALLIAKYFQKSEVDWFTVSDDNIRKVSKFYGQEKEQIYLPPPMCFSKFIKI